MATNNTSPNDFTLTDLRCEGLIDPLGIDVAEPRLSWRMVSSACGAAQTAWQVLCATDQRLLKDGEADLWDSGKVTTDQSQHVKYLGKPIARGIPCY
jgi:alpha-L-rhamnosidase